jgi:hypothetical protein
MILYLYLNNTQNNFFINFLYKHIKISNKIYPEQFLKLKGATPSEIYLLMFSLIPRRIINTCEKPGRNF